MVKLGSKQPLCIPQDNREALTLAYSRSRTAVRPWPRPQPRSRRSACPDTSMDVDLAAVLQAAGVRSAEAVQEAEDAHAVKVGACICHLALHHHSTTHTGS